MPGRGLVQHQSGHHASSEHGADDERCGQGVVRNDGRQEASGGPGENADDYCGQTGDREEALKAPRPQSLNLDRCCAGTLSK